ncbi:hypothetical protein ACIA8O_36690 [Kitasatospora sp. NPDC051853]|uniref:hypothetical protein n=1 Tax=Kitasatospora sp. NPDC051853 TaxID=3364058 RepID=UPI0037A1323D
MSTHVPPAPYPHLLGWFTAGAPDAALLAEELDAMAQGPDLARLLTALRLHGELDHFRTALLVSFPQLDLAAPQFIPSQQPLTALASAGLKAVGVSCLTAIALGAPEPAFDPALFTWTVAGLCYDKVPVFGTVGGERRRVFVSGQGKLYVVTPDHDLKGWLQRAGSDLAVTDVHGVAPDDHESGYNALESVGNLTWECSFGEFDTPEHLLQAIAKSEAFAKVAWGTSSCHAGWVSSLMPTLATWGTFRIPNATVTIGQNVHTATVIGSAWIKDMTGADCPQELFPQAWEAGVRATLLPRAVASADLAAVTMFCNFLKQNKFKPLKKAPAPERNNRISFLLTQRPADRATLRALPNIAVYYDKLF